MSQDGRIHLLNNGRSPLNKKGDLITYGKAEQMVNEALLAEREENEKMVKWYMQQIPGLVAKMLGDALAVNGLVMAPPPEVPAVDADQGGEAAAPDAGVEA